MSNQNISRRQFITISLAGAAAGSLGHKFVSAEQIKLSDSDPMAVALAYVEDAKNVDTANNPTFKPGNDCSNCAQFKNPGADGLGSCALFPGKGVPASAWCKAWVKK